MAHGDIAVRPDPRQQLGRPKLMRRICIGVEKVDDHRLRTTRQKRLTGGAHRHLVQRRDDTARIIHPLRHLEPQVARDDRVEMPLHAIGLRPCAAAKFQNIAEPGGGNQPSAAELAFQNGVGRRCRAMDDKRHARQFAVRLGDGVHHPEGLIVQRAGDLGKPHRAASLVQPDKVGKGAAHIDTDEVAIQALLAAVHSCHLLNPHPGGTAAEKPHDPHMPPTAMNRPLCWYANERQILTKSQTDFQNDA